MSSLIGKILEDKYEIIELVGQGGMAMVYKAKDIRLNRFVAIKVLKSEFMENEQFLKKFMREAQSDAKLTHPNIVSVFDVGIQDGLYFIVMEYIDGKTLKSYIKSKKRLSAQETAELVLPIANALAHAHQNNIIHRDIKPHNILLTSSKTPKVADFGIARAITSSTVTATDEALGSVHYISPEQARGGFLDARSDLYSLGILMYEMLTGELPYDADTPVAVALKHVQNKVPDPSLLNADIPENMSQIVLNLTRRKADDRYQNAGELISDLRAFLENPDIEIEPTYSEEGAELPRVITRNDPKVIQPATRPARRFRLGYVLITAATVVVALVLIGLIVWDSQTTVPYVVSLHIDSATAAIEKAKLDVVIKYDNSVETASGFVISQEPVNGTQVKKNSKVVIVVSNGPKLVETPQLEGLLKDEALSLIKEIGLKPQENTAYDDDVEKDHVISQSPRATTKIQEGETVQITISLGPKQITVPSLIGLTEDAVALYLQQSGLLLGTIQRVEDAKPIGVIIDQDPNPSTTVEKNTRVNITVSKGQQQAATLSVNVAEYLPNPSAPSVQLLVRIKGSNETIFDETVFATEIRNIPITGYSGEKVVYEIVIDNTVVGEKEHQF